MTAIYQEMEMPSVARQQEIACTKMMRKGNHVLLDTGRRFAVVVFKLVPAVGRDDLPALRDAILAVPGIQDVDLMMGGVALESVSEGRELILYVHGDLQIRDVPSEPG